ncbi:DUF6046 domain-containing protein [Aquimarina sp. D1M17]|uniref:DUF6046 domain-containing protein n=1 Tax=Aquimarina acroporae TaxID=2937283 RepID=UPI0020BE94BF|nr:DUF6046 domain-containing protein [Aquimarina acroporae]MCK8520233.1 DUF6046 domain-containing protein [Aquimarina acroporae]
MSFNYNIPNLLNSLRLSQSRSVVRNVTNILASSSEGDYLDGLRNLTEEYFFEPLKDLTDVDEFIMAGGSFSLPVFAPLVIEIPEDKVINTGSELGINRDFFGNNEFVTELAGAAFGFRLDGVSISVSRSKNIVTTAIQGRDYTVKEFISNGDHSITVNGVLATSGRGYPTARVVQLRKILEAEQTLKVTNPIFRKMGVFEIVVTNYEFPSNQGMKNIQPFSFSALSEVPLEIKQQQQDASLKGIGKSVLKDLASRF